MVTDEWGRGCRITIATLHNDGICPSNDKSCHATVNVKVRTQLKGYVLREEEGGKTFPIHASLNVYIEKTRH